MYLRITYLRFLTNLLLDASLHLKDKRKSEVHDSVFCCCAEKRSDGKNFQAPDLRAAPAEPFIQAAVCSLRFRSGAGQR